MCAAPSPPHVGEAAPEDRATFPRGEFRFTLRELLVPFVLLSGLGLLLAYPALPWPMVFDDLHVIRSFTAEEVLSSFHGHWDPDGIETRGLRPFTLLFDFARYRLFGEDMVAHRLFLVVLFALYWALLVGVATHFGMARWIRTRSSPC